MCLCVWRGVCLCQCVGVCVRVRDRVFVCLCLCFCAHTQACICACLYTRTCMCVCACVSACVCVCVSVCVFCCCYCCFFVLFCLFFRNRVKVAASQSRYPLCCAICVYPKKRPMTASVPSVQALSRHLSGPLCDEWRGTYGGHRLFAWRKLLAYRKQTRTAVVWTYFPFITSSQNHFARHNEGGKKTRQTEEEVGRQYQGMDRPAVHQVSEGSGEQKKKTEKTGCEINCGAPTSLAFKGLRSRRDEASV